MTSALDDAPSHEEVFAGEDVNGLVEPDLPVLADGVNDGVLRRSSHQRRDLATGHFGVDPVAFFEPTPVHEDVQGLGGYCIGFQGISLRVRAIATTI
jgi:hypothetical protein